MGKFSADRTINEYAKHIWKVRPVGIRGLQHGRNKQAA
jgi:hypothetical protein